MISEVIIKNFVLIDHAVINFDKGLNIITGETGAGKSIIFDAIKTVFSNEASTQKIKNGRDTAKIQLVFDISDSQHIMPILEDNDIDIEDNLLIFSKTLRKNTRNSVRINGFVHSVKTCQRLKEFLIDIHGQNEKISLLNEDRQLSILDNYNSNEIYPCLNDLQKITTRINGYKKELSSLSIDKMEIEREIDSLNRQYEEIEAVELSAEDKNIEQDYNYYKNIESVYSSTNEVVSLLNNEAGVIEKMNEILQALESIKEYDEKIGCFQSAAQNIFYEIEGLKENVRDYLYEIDLDTDQIRFIENRMNEINLLKKKYGHTISEILDYQSSIVTEIDHLRLKENRKEELLQLIDDEKKEYFNVAKKLRLIRTQTALDFEQKISNQLNDLNMPNAIFKVKINDVLDDEGNYIIRSRGIDSVSFCLMANKGSRVMPINSIASGGELSRLMLAIKIILGDSYNVNSYIFDEIDSGISGRTASSVGYKMSELAEHNQIISVTHLPQIAVLANKHILIEKESTENTTISNYRVLDKQSRIDEIARLISGNEVTETSVLTAKQMLENKGGLH